jgi:hypothetical protein
MAAAGLEIAPKQRPWWGRLSFVLFCAVVAIGLFAMRVVWAGEAQMRASSAALKAGNAREATRCARRAASWYAPGAPHVSAAYKRLLALARGAERARRPELARAAWQGVRTAALDSRWLLQPRRAELELANRSLARLAARQQKPGSEVDAKRLQKQLAGLRRDETPRAPWIALLVVAFALALGGLGNVTRLSAGAAGEVRLALAKRNLFVSAVGIVLWLVAMWRA